MEKSPIKDLEIKSLLKNVLTDEINSREVYMKYDGIELNLKDILLKIEL